MVGRRAAVRQGLRGQLRGMLCRWSGVMTDGHDAGLSADRVGRAWAWLQCLTALAGHAIGKVLQWGHRPRRHPERATQGGDSFDEKYAALRRKLMGKRI